MTRPKFPPPGRGIGAHDGGEARHQAGLEVPTGQGRFSSRSLPVFASEVRLPTAGEEVLWNTNFRATVPEYIGDQLREAAHRMACTQVALLLYIMAEHLDPSGRPAFFIRDIDLVADRRKPDR